MRQARAFEAIARTRDWLLGQQHPEGYWVAELEGDTILESETILLLAFLGREDSELARRAVQYLLEKQLPEGGWAMYPGGGVEISGSVKAYFALKLSGHDVDSEPMRRARNAILAHGGADAANSYTRFFLAMLGQIPYEQCPAVPPEVVLLPKWFPVNLYAVSTWSRTIIVPLSIISALQPVRRLERCRGIRELFLRDPKDWPPLRCPGEEDRTVAFCANETESPHSKASRAQGRKSRIFSWDRFFRIVDKLLKICQRLRLLPWRRRAIRVATRWMLQRFERSDGLGAIFPPIVFSLVALRALGYDDASPEVAGCLRQLEDLALQDANSGSIRLQPCKSPVWDTAIAVRALAAGGLRADDAAMQRAFAWLVDQQISRPGDWSETVAAEPGAWCFEFHNDFYPDSDDTAMVLMALAEQFGDGRDCRERPPWRSETRSCGVHGDSRNATEGACYSRPSDAHGDAQQIALMARSAEAIDRGLAWMLAMQNDDGGWGAFDRNNNRQFLCYVPFADHNAMIDPSTPDLTGRVLEALGRLGRRIGDRAVDRAVAYLRRTQESDGSWFGRWGVNYIYGTWQALVGLASVGLGGDDPAVVAGARWLLATQQRSGGWGETAESYADPRLRGQGPATASQTAWGVMGLLAAGLEDHPAVTRGVQFLVDRQAGDGTWEEKEFTGTGFPRVFYLRYHYYPIYFPLLALGRWASRRAGGC
jgi:squalene-hopene/tetraprenyl-beta-curcumene cyclase